MEEEKRAFKALIDMKQNMVIDLKDYHIEAQISKLGISNLDSNTRAGGEPPQD